MMNVYKHLRTAHAMTIADWAEKLGVSPRAVSTWEKGEKAPKGSNLVKLLDTTPRAFEARRELVEILVRKTYAYKEAWSAVMALDMGNFSDLDTALVACFVLTPSEAMKRSSRKTRELLTKVANIE